MFFGNSYILSSKLKNFLIQTKVFNAIFHPIALSSEGFRNFSPFFVTRFLEKKRLLLK